MKKYFVFSIIAYVLAILIIIIPTICQIQFTPYKYIIGAVLICLGTVLLTTGLKIQKNNKTDDMEK